MKFKIKNEKSNEVEKTFEMVKERDGCISIKIIDEVCIRFWPTETGDSLWIYKPGLEKEGFNIYH